MGRFKSKLDTVKQTYRLCRLANMPEPAWLEPYLALCKAEGLIPGTAKSDKPVNTKRVRWPEDSHIQSYYDKYPNAIYEPIDMTSFEPPPVKKYAIRVQELIEKKGLDTPGARRWAREQIEFQMRSKGELRPVKAPSAIEAIQAEEERTLMNALQQRKQEEKAESGLSSKTWER